MRLGILGLALSAATLAVPATVAAPAGAATVREPAYDLPHIFAETDVELARENGREIAQDRLAQFILLARAGRGSLYQAFGALDASIVEDDIEARRTGYTSSELNRMFERLPAREREVISAYCEGVNDTIEAVYAGTLPEPLEVRLLRNQGLAGDLFGNATDVSDGVDPHYRAPGGADPRARSPASSSRRRWRCRSPCSRSEISASRASRRIAGSPSSRPSSRSTARRRAPPSGAT